MITRELHCRRRQNDGAFPPRSSDTDAEGSFNVEAGVEAAGWQTRLFEAGVFTPAEILRQESWEQRSYDYDPQLVTHHWEVASLSAWISRTAGDPLPTQGGSFRAGLTHDVGKICIDHFVLYEATPAEWIANRVAYREIVSKHALHGYECLRQEKSRFSRTCALVAALHHFDQEQPYPSLEELGERGIQVPKSGRVFDIIQYVRLADSIQGTNRYHESEREGEMLSRTECKERLKQRMPMYGELIELAYQIVK